MTPGIWHWCCCRGGGIGDILISSSTYDPVLIGINIEADEITETTLTPPNKKATDGTFAAAVNRVTGNIAYTYCGNAGPPYKRWFAEQTISGWEYNEMLDETDSPIISDLAGTLVSDSDGHWWYAQSLGSDYNHWTPLGGYRWQGTLLDSGMLVAEMGYVFLEPNSDEGWCAWTDMDAYRVCMDGPSIAKDTYFDSTFKPYVRAAAASNSFQLAAAISNATPQKMWVRLYQRSGAGSWAVRDVPVPDAETYNTMNSCDVAIDHAGGVHVAWSNRLYYSGVHVGRLYYAYTAPGTWSWSSQVVAEHEDMPYAICRIGLLDSDSEVQPIIAWLPGSLYATRIYMRSGAIWYNWPTSGRYTSTASVLSRRV